MLQCLPMDEDLTVQQAARRLGVSYTSIRRYIKRNALRAWRITPNGPWRIPESAIEELKEERMEW